MLPKDFGGGLSTQAVVVILDGCLGRRKIPKGCRLRGLASEGGGLKGCCSCENSIGAACKVVVVVAVLMLLRRRCGAFPPFAEVAVGIPQKLSSKGEVYGG